MDIKMEGLPVGLVFHQMDNSWFLGILQEVFGFGTGRHAKTTEQ
jgi:hypothetical protein